MYLNVFGRVVENLCEYFDGVRDLPVPCEYLRFRNLSYHERVIESRGFKIERPRCAHNVRRIRFGNVFDAEIVEALQVHILVGLKASQLLKRLDGFLVIPLAHRGLDERIESSDEGVVFAYAQEDLCQPVERADMVHITVEHFTQEINGFVFFALCDKHVKAAVNLLGCAIEVANLQKPSAHFKQVVIAISIKLNQAEKSPLRIIHHPC